MPIHPKWKNLVNPAKKSVNIYSWILFVLSASMVLGCQPDTPQNQLDSNAANPVNIDRTFDDQAYLVQLVREAEIANNDSVLAHISHTRSLTIDGQAYAVIDMRELIKGATTPRGFNQIILLNSENQPINRVEYGNARPLFCENNKLYLYGDVIPDGQAEEGNVLVFTDAGFAVTAIKEDLNSKRPPK